MSAKIGGDPADQIPGQSTIFDDGGPPPVGRANSITSGYAAANAYTSGQISRQRWRVYTRLSDAGWSGLTDEEMQTVLAMSGNSQRPARVWLTQNGWVEDSGKTRGTLAGFQAVVWIVTPR